MSEIYWGQYDRDEGIQQAYDMMKHLKNDDSYLKQTLQQMERDRDKHLQQAYAMMKYL